MKKEERARAISTLMRLQEPEPYEPQITQEAYEALQMAIDALSRPEDCAEMEQKGSNDNCIRPLQEIADDLYALAKHYTLDCGMEVHDVNILIALADEVDAWASRQAVIEATPETAARIVAKSRNGMTLWFECDKCNEPVDQNDCYCSGCGRRLEDGGTS